MPTGRVNSDLPITDGQRKALFATGRRLGFDRDDLRAMTPAGSISALSQAQARALLNLLAGPYRPPDPPPRRRRLPTGALRPTTHSQKTYIRFLCIQLGWSREQLDDWIRSHFHLDGLQSILISRDAARLIEGLKAMVDRRAKRELAHAGAL